MPAGVMAHRGTARQSAASQSCWTPGHLARNLLDDVNRPGSGQLCVKRSEAVADSEALLDGVMTAVVKLRRCFHHWLGPIGIRSERRRLRSPRGNC